MLESPMSFEMQSVALQAVMPLSKLNPALPGDSQSHNQLKNGAA